MTEPQANINGLQVALLALLPKGWARVTVADLVRATGTDRRAVTDAMFNPCLANQVGFETQTDSYFAIPQGNELNNDLSTERKST